LVINPITLLNPLFTLGKNEREEGLLFLYKDKINSSTLDRILAIAEYQLSTITEEKSIKKKMFNVLVEAVQNILKHGDNETRVSEMYKSMLVIGREGLGFFIISGNVVKRAKLENLQKRLGIINELDNIGLKKLYNQSIQDNPFSDKGGAGLGLIDIARKTGNKIEYAIHDLDNEHIYLTMKSSFSGKE